MSQWGYVILAWVSTFAIIAVFAVLTITRGRRLSRQVPPEDRRWM